ncbi:MAG: oxidoreductase [Rhodobacteraceae bacterium]|nr:oxidoreductase [Paracoccaceae bacterium]
MSLAFLAPLPLLALAAMFIAVPGRRPGPWPRYAEIAALVSLALCIGGGLQLIAAGTGSAGTVLRLDTVAAVMAVLVSFVGWVVVRFSGSYLDGEAREGAFHGQLLATVAAVLVLVLSANLAVTVAAFLAIGVLLRQLLLFYPDRMAARRAAAKFSLVWGVGDAVLILAAGLLWASAGSLNIATLQTAFPDGLTLTAQIAVGLIVLCALLKTAAFPLHGWLTEVMEAPTPVSALLHAGIINAGGLLLIRFAELIQASPVAMTALVMLGGATALFGALVMLTQGAVKTALAWSTVSQMGFMILQCGLGLWALALLHIVAHSLYKAHAFLNSSTGVRAVRDVRRPGPVAVPGGGAVARAFLLALLLYAVVAALFGAVLGPKSPQAIALGAILIFGVAYLVAQGLADTAPKALTQRTALAATAAAIGYFSFHQIAGWLIGAGVPAAPTPGPLEWALILLTLVSFGVVAVAQSLFPLWAHHPATSGLRVHVANGFYLNALLDRLIGGFRTQKSL